MKTTEKRIKVEYVGEVAVVHFFGGKIPDDNQIIWEIGDGLFYIVDNLDRRKIVLNLDGISYVSPPGLGKMLALVKKVNEKGGKLVLCHICDEALESIKTKMFDKLFNIVETQEEAIKEIGE